MKNTTLKVLCILESAGAGSGRHVVDLLRGLIGRGHDPTLLFSRTRLEGWFEQELADIEDLRVSTMDMSPGIGPGDIAAVRSVRRFLRDQGPFDVIHGHSSKGGALLRLAARPSDGVRVYTPHALYTLGCEPGSLRRAFFARLEQILATRCEGIICVSEAERRHAIECGLPSDKLFTVANGLGSLPPVDRAEVRDSLGLHDGDVAIGFVGRLVSQKAVGRLVAAFAKVRSAVPSTRLVVVGDGPEEGEARKLAESSGIADAVIWTGRADGQRMMGGFDIFASCARYEAFPYVFLEAMARGLPIVSTRVGGVDETIREGDNGMVVEQDDTDALAGALIELSRDEARRRSMGECSLALLDEFGVEGMVDRTLEVYSALLERR